VYKSSAHSDQINVDAVGSEVTIVESKLIREEHLNEKVERDWSHSIGSSSAVRGTYIASSKFVFVHGQGPSPCWATANTRERRWRSPQAC